LYDPEKSGTQNSAILIKYTALIAEYENAFFTAKGAVYEDSNCQLIRHVLFSTRQ